MDGTEIAAVGIVAVPLDHVQQQRRQNAHRTIAPMAVLIAGTFGHEQFRQPRAIVDRAQQIARHNVQRVETVRPVRIADVDAIDRPKPPPCPACDGEVLALGIGANN